MTFSTPATPRKRDPLAILLLGPPGSFKTTLAMQFPKVAFMDCDRNLDGPEKWIRKTNPNLSYGFENINTDDNGKEVPPWDKFDRLQMKLKEVQSNPEVETVVIDTMTMVNEFIVQKVLKEQGQSLMRPMDYQPMKSYYWRLLVGGIRGCGKTTIVTCHEVIMTKPGKTVMTEEIVGYKPSVSGGIADYFGGFFTDIWRCESRPLPGDKQQAIIRTNKSILSPDLKSSCGLPAEMEAKYENIAKYLTQ
jgi:hypothetical protein